MIAAQSVGASKIPSANAAVPTPTGDHGPQFHLRRSAARSALCATLPPPSSRTGIALAVHLRCRHVGFSDTRSGTVCCPACLCHGGCRNSSSVPSSQPIGGNRSCLGEALSLRLPYLLRPRARGHRPISLVPRPPGQLRPSIRKFGHVPIELAARASQVERPPDFRAPTEMQPSGPPPQREHEADRQQSTTGRPNRQRRKSVWRRICDPILSVRKMMHGSRFECRAETPLCTAPMKA